MRFVKEIKLNISMTNDAFSGNEGQEVARILRNLADELDSGGKPRTLRDLNGNTVGGVEYLE